MERNKNKTIEASANDSVVYNDMGGASNIAVGEISSAALTVAIDSAQYLETIKKKVGSISIGKLVTVIHGDFENQKVLRGKIVSLTENGITIIDNDVTVKDPVLVQYKKIIDIFEVKKFSKPKEPFSMFKLNKKIVEFFYGDEDELKHAYEMKISVKKLRDELKKNKTKQ